MIWISLERDVRVPLIRQLFEQIKEKILSGELKEGEKLPSTRELAQELKVSRNVVIEAYEQLMAEGYVESREGSGTYVQKGTMLRDGVRDSVGHESGKSANNEDQRDVIDFRSGIPALDQFPLKVWGRFFRDLCSSVPDDELGYGNNEGCRELRQAVTSYLHRTRGIVCDPDQVVITTGAVQALSLASKLLLSRRKQVIIEEPSNIDLQVIFSSAGAELHPVQVDDKGLITGELPEAADPEFIYVTPSHQFPLGGILSAQRRVELIEYAARKECYIIEDDYDSEFRYEGMPVSPLQGLYPGKVVYVGTFSKTLFPALRLGYLILPRNLVESCRYLKRHADFQTPVLDQLTLARFIKEGHMERHISKMKKVYKRRREALIEALQEHFPGSHAIYGKAAGLHLVAGFQDIDFTEELLGRISYEGVKVYPADMHSLLKNQKGKLILGYGNIDEKRIFQGIGRLSRALKKQSR